MKVLFKETFAGDLERIADKELLGRARRVIESVQNAHNPQEIPNIRKLRAPGNYFRIRVGQYRIGLLAQKDEIIFVRCLHRRDVYRYFP